jgi:hypothetical protein
MSFKNTAEELAYNRRVKKLVVEALFEACETFYLQCVSHPDLNLGGRGLTEREEQEGIVLVFGPYSTRRLRWDDLGIDCDMHFTRWESVHIPWECVKSAVDKAGHLLIQWLPMTVREPNLRDAAKVEQEEPSAAPEFQAGEKSDLPTPGREPEKIIEIDFTKRKKK